MKARTAIVIELVALKIKMISFILPTPECVIQCTLHDSCALTVNVNEMFRNSSLFLLLIFWWGRRGATAFGSLQRCTDMIQSKISTKMFLLPGNGCFQKLLYSTRKLNIASLI